MNTYIQLDVIPFHNDFTSCFEECMISVANYYRRGYILMYSQAWGFSFETVNYKINGIGNSIKDDRGRVYDLFDFYHGIRLSFTDNGDPFEVMNIIISGLLNNNPIGVHMDTFYYSWDPNKNQHGKHWFLITGVDTAKKVFYCTDPYFLQKDSVLDFEDFIKGYLGVFFSFKINKPETPDYDWKQFVYKIAEKFEGKNRGRCIFENMSDFADIVEDEFSTENERASYSRVVDMPYYTNLQSVSRGRLQYASFLEHTAARYNVNDLPFLSEKLRQASYKWDVLRGIITKGILASNESIIKAKIPPKIREIASAEADVLNLLIDAASGTSPHKYSVPETSKNTPNSFEKVNFADYSYIDLSDYFNNKAFGALLNENSKADFNGAGLFLVEEDFCRNDFWLVNDMRFKFPRTETSQNDNVTCSGQLLEFPPVKCGIIMLLGTADFGSFKDSILVHFTSGTTEEITVGFTELIFDPQYGETTAREGRACERLNGTVQIHNSRVKIFAKTYSFSNPGDVARISLPYLPNIHIFAITLA
ncbi:MAG TPA: hypothetical protein VHP38_15860 [Ruminiclostridium sp.]|nr:hypothetical protein [Ruminiclostridium sp.]